MNKEKEQAARCGEIEQKLKDYTFKMIKELNLRLLCDFAGSERILFVEELVITDIR